MDLRRFGHCRKVCPSRGRRTSCTWYRARKHVARFVKNRERLVDRFDVMIRADIAIAVWRRASAELGCSPSLKGQKRPRHRGRRPPKTFNQLLQPWRRGCLLWWRAVPVRIASQDSLVGFLLWRDVREISQVLRSDDRTDHLHDIGSLCAGSVLRAYWSRLVCWTGFVRFPWANSATAMPSRQNTEAVKMRRLKKADFEVDFFFMVKWSCFPLAVNPRR